MAQLTMFLTKMTVPGVFATRNGHAAPPRAELLAGTRALS